METESITYRIRPAIIVPIILTIIAVGFAVTTTLWALIAMPFIVLGSLCSAPNHNLANGFLAVVASIVGLIILAFNPHIGGAIFLGSSISWFFSSFEKRRRAIPIFKEESIE